MTVFPLSVASRIRVDETKLPASKLEAEAMKQLSAHGHGSYLMVAKVDCS